MYLVVIILNLMKILIKTFKIMFLIIIIRKFQLYVVE